MGCLLYIDSLGEIAESNIFIVHQVDEIPYLKPTGEEKTAVKHQAA